MAAPLAGGYAAAPSIPANRMTDQVILAFSSCPDEACAERIAQTLVTEGLATCVNRIPGIRSTYVWDGRLKDDREVLLLIKTIAPRIAALTARLVALHPYELPELVTIAVTGGNEPYLEWVRMGAILEDRDK
jgi:periplasmic divalent cation tolerance protein